MMSTASFSPYILPSMIRQQAPPPLAAGPMEQLIAEIHGPNPERRSPPPRQPSCHSKPSGVSHARMRWNVQNETVVTLYRQGYSKREVLVL